MTDIQITDKPLDVSKIYDQAVSEEAGAVNMFIGTVRIKTADRTVVRLEYESYEKMAITEMSKIADVAHSKWPVKNIIIHHRYGNLKVTDKAVVIAVSTPHRKDSFEACQYIIDTLKQKVPIWKKEVFSDGEEWVSAHP